MGRHSTGAITTNEAIKLELSFMLKKGFLKKGCIKQGYLFWGEEDQIEFISCLLKEDKYIRLIYSNINIIKGGRSYHDYKIKLTSIPSNLGRGEILYFVCPISGKRSRILYKAYESPIFKSRQAYNKRIYYSYQKCQKNEYHSERYIALKELIKKLPEGRKSHYRGNETRIRKRIRRLNQLKQFHDKKSLQVFANYLKNNFLQ